MQETGYISQLEIEKTIHQTGITRYCPCLNNYESILKMMNSIVEETCELKESKKAAKLLYLMKNRNMISPLFPNSLIKKISLSDKYPILEARNNKETLSFLLLGDGGVGKTSLVKTIENKQFVNAQVSWDWETTVDLDNNFKLQCIDLPGQEDFASIRSNFYKNFSNIDAVLLCFSLSNRVSFENLHYWIPTIETSYSKKIFFLIGTKAQELHEVTEAEIKTLTHSLGNSQYYACKNDYESIQKMFIGIAKRVVCLQESSLNEISKMLLLLQGRRSELPFDILRNMIRLADSTECGLGEELSQKLRRK